MNVSAIFAADDHGGIGIKNSLPWHIPKDFQWFKTHTLHRPIIMGWNTWLSIGKPLPSRLNIVLSRDPDKRETLPNHVVGMPSMEDALDRCVDYDEAVVIGGTSVFRDALEYMTYAYYTHVIGNYGCDIFLPEEYAEIFTEWEFISRGPLLQENSHAFRFNIMGRK